MKSRISQWLVEGLRPRGFQLIRWSAFLIVPILAACSDSTGPTRFVVITPASQTVALETTPTGKILRTSITLTNTSSFPVTWDYCGLTLEKNISGIIELADGPRPPWFTVWVQACYLLSAEAIAYYTTPLQPGQSVTIPIAAPVGQSFSALPFDGSPGEYRVHLTLATQILHNQYRTVPHDFSVSDSFMIVAQ
jgi:hypothetical protein